jgi:hypothetical protein
MSTPSACETPLTKSLAPAHCAPPNHTCDPQGGAAVHAKPSQLPRPRWLRTATALGFVVIAVYCAVLGRGCEARGRRDGRLGEIADHR